MFKVCLENRIVCRENDYKCFLCHCEDIDKNYEAIKEHLKHWRHKKVLKGMDEFERKKELDVIDALSETERKILVENYIAIANRINEKYRCYMCASYLPNLSSVFNHVQAFGHKINYKKRFHDTLTAINRNEKISAVGSGKVDKPFFFEKEYWCQICEITLKQFALIKCHSMAHFFQNHKVKQDDIIYFHYHDNNVAKITCLLCEKSINTIELLEHHLNTYDHQSRMSLLSSNEIKDKTKHDVIGTTITGGSFQCEEFREYVTVINIFCKVCSALIPVAEFENHTNTKDHYDKALLQTLDGTHACKLKDPKSKTKLNSSNSYMCFVCNQSFDKSINLIHHYNNNQHKNKIMTLYRLLEENQTTKLNIPLEHNKKLNISNKDLVLLTNSQSIKLEFENSNDLKCNIAHLKNGTKNNLTQVSTSEISKQNLLLPRNRKPRKPKVNKEIAYLFDKKLAIFGDTFINMCIESGDRNIYSISEEMCRLINSSIKLIVPRSPTWICIPCADEIEDNEFSIFEHLNGSKHRDNINKLEADDRLFIDCPSQFSDLKLAKACIQEESDNHVYCYACSTKVPNFDDSIKDHLLVSEHIQNKNVFDIELEEMLKVLLTFIKSFWYYAHFFICEVCTVNFEKEIEFIIHIKSKEHLQKTKSKCIAGKFHSCPSCVTCWYGSSDAYDNHVKGSRHKLSLKIINSSEFMIPPIPIFTNGLLNELERSIKYLIYESDKANTQETKKEELLFLHSIESTVKAIYPMAKAYIFDSRLSYLSFCDSDFNIYLDCEDTYYKNISEQKSKQYLITVKNIFENQKHDWIIEDILLDQRIPLIKIRNINSNQTCNVSFKSSLDVEKWKLVRKFNTALPLCRKLILYLKKWLELCLFTESNGINRYTATWLVIFFLQTKGIFPSVHQLIKIQNITTFVDGWECSFEEDIPVAIINLTFKDLVKEFFSYYANFDYKLNVICPYLGKTIKKTCFANIEQIPEQMKYYQNCILKGEVEFFRLDSPMCLQDPINHSQNITKAVTKLDLQHFMQYCTESLDMLKF